MTPLVMKDDRKQTTQVIGFPISLPELRPTLYLAAHKLLGQIQQQTDTSREY
jgi:hypothetical protein